MHVTSPKSTGLLISAAGSMLDPSPWGVVLTSAVNTLTSVLLEWAKRRLNYTRRWNSICSTWSSQSSPQDCCSRTFYNSGWHSRTDRASNPQDGRFGWLEWFWEGLHEATIAQGAIGFPLPKMEQDPPPDSPSW